MKKTELEGAIEDLHEIKKITDKQEYLVSSAVNVKYNSIIKVLDKELKRLDNEKVEVNCPKLLIIKSPKILQKKDDIDIQTAVNKMLEELVKQDYKIIDFGLMSFNEDMYTAFIKYTN